MEARNVIVFCWHLKCAILVVIGLCVGNVALAKRMIVEQAFYCAVEAMTRPALSLLAYFV